MSRSKILGAATSVALVAMIGGGAVAQTTIQLPAELEALNLSDIRSDEKRGGLVEVEGRTADGVEIEAMLDANGKLLDVEVDRGTMPESLINAVLPQSVRDNDLLTQFATIESVSERNDGFDVQGEDSTGKDLFAVFDQDGRVLRSGHDD